MSDPGPGQILFAFVRHWSRQPDPLAERGNLVLVVEAVQMLARQGIPATVNAVAHAIALDQSGASRLIARAVADGYLTVQVSTVDARRREVHLTASGAVLLEQAHAWQEQVFARLTVDWSDERRQEFQRALTDLMACTDAIVNDAHDASACEPA